MTNNYERQTKDKRRILTFFSALSTQFALGIHLVDCIIFLAQQSVPSDALFGLSFLYF